MRSGLARHLSEHFHDPVDTVPDGRCGQCTVCPSKRQWLRLIRAGLTSPLDFDPSDATEREIDEDVFNQIVKAIGIRDPSFLTRFAVGLNSPLTRRLKLKAAHPELFGALETCAGTRPMPADVVQVQLRRPVRQVR